MTLARSFGVAALAASASSLPAVAQTADAGAVVAAMQAIAGTHKARLSGAKGQCLAGVFKPSADGKAISKSPLFAKSELPVLARFSMGGGNPQIPDNTKGVTRGFALRVDPDGDRSEFVFISAPVFGAKTPEQMLASLQARAPGPDGKPDQEKIKTFTAANPNAANQSKWLASKPVPASWATVPYWGAHVFTLTDAAGKETAVKLKFAPKAGEAGLSDDEAKAKGKDFYAAEIAERLAKGPVAFDLQAVAAREGDPTNDVTALWPEEESRPAKTLGTVEIARIEDAKACDAETFDPTVLAEGVAGPKDDPMFAIRSPAYALSVVQRAQ
jgi:catalase